MGHYAAEMDGSPGPNHKTGQQAKGDILDIGGMNGVGYGQPIWVREATGEVGWEWRKATVEEKAKMMASLSLPKGQ